jgi:hypothetical protein
MATDQPGWDPYEVWYTRVWLPRNLAEQARIATVHSSSDGKVEAMSDLAASAQPFVASAR